MITQGELRFPLAVPVPVSLCILDQNVTVCHKFPQLGMVRFKVNPPYSFKPYHHMVTSARLQVNYRRDLQYGATNSVLDSP